MVNTASKCKIETHFQRSQVRSSAALGQTRLKLPRARRSLDRYCGNLPL